MSYPSSPGAKEATTSADAAKEAAKRSLMLRSRVFEALKLEPMSADQVAAKLGENILAIRPRLSELRATGQIEPSGRRAKNESGASAHVWQVKIERPALDLEAAYRKAKGLDQ